MYRYPNGLECDASELRVKAYEMIVPRIAAGLSLVGFVVALMRLGDRAEILKSFVLIMTAGTAWTLVCALGSILIFDLWCRPVDGGLLGHLRRRGNS